MTFEEIPARMLKLGVDRAWLMKECRYSKSTLASTLAPKGTNRNERALKTIWEALDREEERQRKTELPEPLGHRVFIEPTEEQFERWTQAAHAEKGRTFNQWAIAGLETLAAEELGKLSNSSAPKTKIQSLKDPPRKQAKRKAN